MKSKVIAAFKNSRNIGLFQLGFEQTQPAQSLIGNESFRKVKFVDLIVYRSLDKLNYRRISVRFEIPRERRQTRRGRESSGHDPSDPLC